MKDEGGTTCPLCADSFEDRSDLRIHLMVCHRKSAVADELLRTVDEREMAPLSSI